MAMPGCDWFSQEQDMHEWKMPIRHELRDGDMHNVQKARDVYKETSPPAYWSHPVYFATPES
eukprot:6139600-Amphidinium_carterae.1